MPEPDPTAALLRFCPIDVVHASRESRDRFKADKDKAHLEQRVMQNLGINSKCANVGSGVFRAVRAALKAADAAEAKDALKKGKEVSIRFMPIDDNGELLGEGFINVVTHVGLEALGLPMAALNALARAFGAEFQEEELELEVSCACAGCVVDVPPMLSPQKTFVLPEEIDTLVLVNAHVRLSARLRDGLEPCDEGYPIYETIAENRKVRKEGLVATLGKLDAEITLV